MFEHVGLMVLKGFQDRAERLNNYLGELLGEKRNYLIDIDSPRFSNGEGKVQINETVRDKEIYIIADVGNYNVTYNLYGKENRMSPDDHFFDIIRAVSAISGKARKITLFMEYLLRVNKGKQVDGVTLKEFTDVMKEVAHELKKQGVNINQMARYINQYPDLATATSFRFYERAYKNLEDKVLELLERVA